MADPRILPRDLRIGDVISSDPRRDFTVRAALVRPDGDVVINLGDPDQATILADQLVAIRRPT